MKLTYEEIRDTVIDVWIQHYQDGHCTLCGNHGVIDTRRAKTPAGLTVGRLNYCICPNGWLRREHNAALYIPE